MATKCAQEADDPKVEHEVEALLSVQKARVNDNRVDSCPRELLEAPATAVDEDQTRAS